MVFYPYEKCLFISYFTGYIHKFQGNDIRRGVIRISMGLMIESRSRSVREIAKVKYAVGREVWTIT